MTGRPAAEAVVRSTDGGYAVVVRLPADGLAQGGTLGFDVRVTDGEPASQSSWNDLPHDQEDGARLGAVTLMEPVVEGAVSPEPDPAISLGADRVRAGGTVSVELTGFRPDEPVQVLLETNGSSVLLDEVTVHGDGAASAEVTVPGQTKPGRHTVAAVQGDLRVEDSIIVTPHVPGRGGPT